MNPLDQQTIALAGCLQSLLQTRAIAKHGHGQAEAFTVVINSLFCQNPRNTLEVYGGELSHLQPGLQSLINTLRKPQDEPHSAEILRQILLLVHYHRSLIKQDGGLDKLSNSIQRACAQRQHEDSPTTSLMMQMLGGCYEQHISPIQPRIMVSGEPEYLKNPHCAAQIRSSLLAALRAIILWQQLGGKRWHLLLRKRAIAQCATRLINRCAPPAATD